MLLSRKRNLPHVSCLTFPVKMHTKCLSIKHFEHLGKAQQRCNVYSTICYRTDPRHLNVWCTETNIHNQILLSALLEPKKVFKDVNHLNAVTPVLLSASVIERESYKRFRPSWWENKQTMFGWLHLNISWLMTIIASDVSRQTTTQERMNLLSPLKSNLLRKVFRDGSVR